MKAQRKKWFDNHAARLKEVEDQKLHNHLMSHMEQTDIDFKRACLEKDTTEQEEALLAGVKQSRRKKRKQEENKNIAQEHSIDNVAVQDHIHGGPIIPENGKDVEDKTLKITDHEEILKAIKEKCENDYKNELLGIENRISDQKQIDKKTMLRHNKRSENKKVMRSGPWSRFNKSKNDEERFAESKNYYSDNSDDDIGFVGYAEKSFETKIKTDFMRKLSKELIDLIKDEVNKDIGEYQFMKREKEEVNPFETFFKKRDKPGLFDSQASNIDETSSQDGSVWSNDFGKRSVFTITSKTSSSKIDTTPSDILMKSDHSKNSQKERKKKDKLKFFDLEDSDCSQI